MQRHVTHTLATGFAIFSMFFGAGNVVFPLFIGQTAKSQIFFAVFGLLLTAVAVPFIGLLSMTLFDGKYRDFFCRLGSFPGYILEVMILLIIGPFGALPRCIVLAESSLHVYLPFLSLPSFSIIACIVIFFCAWQRSFLLDILGYVLTPILLFLLFLIIGIGFFSIPPSPPLEEASLALFFQGLKTGYHTMDLLGAFFFSSIVLLCLKKEIGVAKTADYKHVIYLAVRAGIIGMSLLSLIYIGLTLVASRASPILIDVPQEELMGRIALELLGKKLGIVASIAVALACLTTAIALAAVFAEFIYEDVLRKKLHWTASLGITLFITFIVTTWRFEGISHFLSPILLVCYPSLITLSFCNLAYKLYGFRPVKGPVFVVFLLSLLAYFF